MPTFTHSPERQLEELTAQLGLHGRPMLILLGAGASIAAGLPGMDDLTSRIAASLDGTTASHFEAVHEATGGGNVEAVLDRLRLMQQLLNDDDQLHGLKHTDAATLDSAVCAAIVEGVSPERALESKPHALLARWIRSTRSPIPVEVYTTNYDLLIERALEQERVPFFDGFVGAVRPFFLGFAVDELARPASDQVSVPRGWVRLWKLHGSVGWRMSEEDGARVVVRDPTGRAGEDLVIYPSFQKYDEARRLPFLTLLDRLRSALAQPEPLLIVCGYSFADDHLTEVITEGARINQRAHVIVLCHDEIPPPIERAALRLANLTVLGRQRSVIGTRAAPWASPADPGKLGSSWTSSGTPGFAMGDFSVFAEFLESLYQFPADLEAAQDDQAESDAE